VHALASDEGRPYRNGSDPGTGHGDRILPEQNQVGMSAWDQAAPAVFLAASPCASAV
jgi:hypothetical protein